VTGGATTPALEARLSIAVGGTSGFQVETDLAIERGVLVLFGPSGSGKSLTLQALAGLVTPRRGIIRVNGETLYDSERRIDVPTHRRRLGYVPQHHSLFPFCSVARNVAFGLPRHERRDDHPRVRQLLDELRIAHLANARPPSLSGGERQRVALARALAVEPQLVLLDEPFSSLDRQGRSALRSIVRATLERHSVPAVFVTHDAEEAIALGDRLVRYEPGRSAESGTPSALLPAAAPLSLHADGVRVMSTGVDDGAEVEIALENVRLRGPAAALPGDGDGAVRLSLRRTDDERREEKS
jgi:molybdate transport system ATP-binding protein